MKQECNILLKGMFKQSGFGFSCMKKASELHIPGRLTYLDEETVNIEAQGERTQIETLFSWCLASKEAHEGTCITTSLQKVLGSEFAIINSL